MSCRLIFALYFFRFFGTGLFSAQHPYKDIKKGIYKINLNKKHMLETALALRMQKEKEKREAAALEFSKYIQAPRKVQKRFRGKTIKKNNPRSLHKQKKFTNLLERG